MDEPLYDVAFVTVSYNTLELVEGMLQFFAGASFPFSYVLVVVDNNSTDGSQEFLSLQRNVTYIQNGENLGYGRAINRGVRSVASRYVCALNSDVLLSVESLTQLWNFMEQHPGVGVVSPRIANRDGTTQGFVFFKSPGSIIFNLLSKIRASLLKLKVANSLTPFRVQGVLGAFFLLRRDVIPGDRLFDEDFFFYFEDTDLAHRLYEAGVPCYVLPSCSLIHLGGMSTSVDSARIFYRSKSLYLVKHYGSTFSRVVCVLDRIRLHLKYLKYSLVSKAFCSSRTAEKKTYYAAMRHLL